MALAALISACQTVEGGEGLRATLPLAGHTLVEHQVRLAARAGAGHVVVLVERVPAALVAAIDRLKRDGIAVDIARGLADAVDRVHPDEALLLIADGLVVPSPTVARFARSRGHAILTLPDEETYARFERIDASARWAGLLLIDGLRLRQVAGMLGDWDLESTLLRSAVQAGAGRITAEDGARTGAPLIAERAHELAGLNRVLFATSGKGGGDWPARYLYPLAERIGTLPLLQRGVDPVWPAIGAASATWLGAALALVGWPGAGLALLLLSGPAAAMARRLAAARLADLRHAALLGHVRAAGAMAALLALGWTLRVTGGWGVWPLALGLLAAMAAATAERRALTRLSGGTVPPWIASLDALILALLPFALARAWLPGLAVLALYAVASLFALQREVAARLAPAAADQD